MSNSKKTTLKSQKTRNMAKYDEICTLLDEVESDLDEDVNDKMNDTDTIFFGNNEVDCNSGSVASA